MALNARADARLADAEKWAATWATAPKIATSPERIANQTLRETLRATIAGSFVRLRVSNAYGKTPLLIGGASLEIAGRITTLKFGGKTQILIPPGGWVASDGAKADVPALSDVHARLYLPQETFCSTQHTTLLHLTEASKPGNSLAGRFQASMTLPGWCFASALDVAVPRGTRSIVAVGDSLTDADSFSPNPNVRWLDVLAERFHAQKMNVAISNMGISGSRLLYDDPQMFGAGVGTGGLERFDRDVIAQPSVTDVIVWLGTNDVGRPGAHAPSYQAVSADELTAGYSQLIQRAHERGLRIFLATILPAKGSALEFYSASKEKVRLATNDWIRRASGGDGVFDFDKILRDAQEPDRIAPEFDLGDATHPNVKGEKKLADSIDLGLFK